ncbi:hypothetical protein K461DRAFT_109187 [Myriangium duriaei CBS 260.36]|uniref:Zn(2)-C6 fungal-type domain-containing protein n=1 Tax=Myriangium duriaei CBS 260.36 TaxID=1168546 RepID=A0A9P4J4B1_9PEZI|nr:hypothetical protein K461DRAFT_109187 [Myriangium duriaei CBS 260.36]
METTKWSILARSCAACRRRKIKCDRQAPTCSYCVKMRLTCSYPPIRQDGEGRRRSLQASSVTSRTGTRANPSPVSSDFSSHEAPADVSEDHSPSSRTATEPFWARVNSEVTASECAVPTLAAEGSNSTLSSCLPLLFSVDRVEHSAASCHPAPTEALRLWQTYLDNVDPLIKIVHSPTIQTHLIRAISEPDSVTPSLKSLLFAIYYASAISSRASRPVLGTSLNSGPAPLADYRHGLVQSLVQARFVDSDDVVTLQAFVIFLICGRFDKDGPNTWALISLAIRIAMRLDLHRPLNSGSAPTISPFDDEMRRRLWWQICILDIRTAEDAGTEPFVPQRFLEVPLPTKVNDLDIYPEMQRAPNPARVAPAMFYNELRIQTTRNLRPILFSSDRKMCKDSLESKTKAIEDLEQRLSDVYFTQCDLQIPLCGFAVSTAKLILAKARLGLYITAGPGMSGWSDEIEDRLFRESVEILEQTHSLITYGSFARWWWLVRTYVEWDAVVMVLRGICRRPRQAISAIERAWKTIEIAFSSADHVAHNPNHQRRWRSLCQLKTRAQNSMKEAHFADGGAPPTTQQQLLDTANVNSDNATLGVTSEYLFQLPEDWSYIFGADAGPGTAWLQDQDLQELCR